MIRVALVVGALPLGGSTTFTLYLASALHSLGIPTEVFSFSQENPLAHQFSAAGVRVNLQNGRRLIYEDRLKAVYNEICRFEPSIVLSVLGVESYEVLRYMPAGVRRLAVILDMAIQPALFVPRYAHAIDQVVVIAGFLLREVEQVEGHPPVSHLQLGIPISKNAEPREPNLHSPLRLIYYGRLEDVSKGVRMFPRIVTGLNQRRIPFCWTIHGNGPEKEFLERALAADVKEGKVTFSDPVSHEELVALIRTHDIYMLASTNEGGPLTLLESMALGLVPVCGNIPALVQDVITSENGFRVDRDNPEAYVDAIAKLDSNRPLLERMSSTARSSVTGEYSAEAMARRYLSFFESLQPIKPSIWPKRIRVKPIIGANPFRYSVLGRWVRRLSKV